MLCNKIKKVRNELNRSQIHLPHCLSSHQKYMIDFQAKKLIKYVKHASISSVLFDLRTAQQKSDAKVNNVTSTLNHQTLDVFSNRP